MNLDPMEQMVGQAVQMMQTLQNSQNPMALLQQMSGSNPDLAKVLEMINSGNNPAQIMENLCKTKGLDPQAIRQAFTCAGFRL